MRYGTHSRLDEGLEANIGFGIKAHKVTFNNTDEWQKRTLGTSASVKDPTRPIDQDRCQTHQFKCIRHATCASPSYNRSQQTT